MPTASKRQLVPGDVALIVFGTDRRRKRRASRFPASAAPVAQSAAATMGMRAIPVLTEAQRALATRLPRGTVSAKGHVDVKLVRAALFDKLVAIADPEQGTPSPPQDGNEAPPKKETGANADSKTTTPADEWSKLTRGKRVLATDADSDGAWYVAVVQHVDQSNIVLIWEDWKSLGKFSRNVTQIGLLNPHLKKPF